MPDILDLASGYLHVVDRKGGKHHTCIIPRLVVKALCTYLQGLGSGIFAEYNV